jgi:RNA polymerase sigma-70 factor (ECF subfamily)
LHSPADDPRSDHELVEAINAGDVEAFASLYRRHRDWAVSLALRFTGDHALALDVLQEAFLYLLKKFPGFELTSQLRTFLYPAVRHLAIAAHQKAGRSQSGGIELAELELPAPAATPDVTTSRDRLAAVLASLSHDHREVLLLRFVDGLSLGEIAEATEVPLGTVKSRLHHALAALRQDSRTRNLFGE